MAADMREADRERDRSFAELAPVYRDFPGLGAADFAAFEKPKQRDACFNAERLIVKRKLAAGFYGRA